MEHKIITIGRQFGSGGHELGEKLSELLGIPLYDRVLVEMAAEKLGLSEISVEEVDESVLNTLLSAYRYPTRAASLAGYGLPLNESTYLAQTGIIETLAKKGPCIIVGRCGDFVLRDHPKCLSLFICASLEDRTKRIAERYGLTEKEAATALKRTDRRRKNYYETYTDQNWGSIDSHQLLINISKLGMEKTLGMIQYLYDQM